MSGVFVLPFPNGTVPFMRSVLSLLTVYYTLCIIYAILVCFVKIDGEEEMGAHGLKSLPRDQSVNGVAEGKWE